VTKKRKTSSRRKSKSRSKSASSQRSSARGSLLSGWSLSRDRKLDLIGLLLLVLSVITSIALFTGSQGVVIAAWLDVLRWTFGWGMYLALLAGFGCGLWLMARTFGRQLPVLELERVIGVVLLFLGMLTFLHAVLGVTDFDTGMAEARLGRGGGAIGAVFLAILFGALGGAGTAVVLLAWFLIGMILAAGLSIPELWSLLVQAVRWAIDFLREKVAGPPQPAYISPVVDKAPPVIAEKVSAPREVTRPQPSAQKEFQHEETASEKAWSLPALTEILDLGTAGKADEAFDRERGKLIEETLQAFGAPARVVEINRGPTITQFGVEPDFIEGRGGRRTKVKVSKISALADDLALALAAPSIRVEAPVPGKGYIGIEVPNTEVTLVALRDLMESSQYRKIKSPLRLGLGKDVSGHPVVANLTRMPHLLIAGTTGSGKSVCVNAIITSLLLQNTPDQLRYLMVDPKRVELTYYNGIPHLLAPVIVDLERVVPALQWISREMDSRYQRFSKEGMRNIEDYNRRMRDVQGRELPYLVVVIDELADLMIMAPDETERVITRLAQLARATGIHLVIATQRPSVDVVTGLIKANFPSRIAFAVASSVDSRVILDQPGAERLLGRGDMLFQAPDAAAPIRMQGAFVSEVELSRLIRFWKNAALGGDVTQPSHIGPVETIPSGVPLKQVPMWNEEDAADEDLDPLYDEAVAIVREMRRASISLLQRRLRIGYTRAARIVDHLEEQGVIGPAKSGSKAREVLDYGGMATAEE
jgi:S-DNA-T family DNA segregation ATPase FtsK/SpoIIIE